MPQRRSLSLNPKGSVSGCAVEAQKERGACGLGQVLLEKLWDLGPIESWGQCTLRAEQCEPCASVFWSSHLRA